MGSLMTQNEMEKIEDFETKEPIVYINGVRRVLPDGLAHLTLLEYLRDIGLTGTKLGCGEGGCGACTVMVSYFDQNSKKCVHLAINACLAPLYSLEGMHIITVEGVGNRRYGLHPIQESLAQSHGSQCGFCTPGFIMSMYALLKSSQKPPTKEDIEENLTGNLCRCTGYRPIVDAFRVFARTNDALYTNESSGLSTSEFVCPSTGKPCSCGLNIKDGEKTTEKSICYGDIIKPISYNDIDGASYTDKELIFPPELQLRKLTNLCLNGSNGLKWYRPLKLQHVFDIKARYPDAKLVAGNTEVGIETRLKNLHYPVLIHVAHVPELNQLIVKNEGLEIGSVVKLSELVRVLKTVIDQRASFQTSSCRSILQQLNWFAGTQIRNIASIGGNICTASPISDLNPLWMAARASFQISDCRGNVRTCKADNFFLGYRKVDLASNEILVSVFLPWNSKYEFVKEFKQAHRRDDDIAIVNAGMRARLEVRDGKWIVCDMSIVYGGVASYSVCAKETNDFLIGKQWNKEALKGVLGILEKEIVMKENAPGGMVEFRKSLILSFFFKFFLWVCDRMDGRVGSFDEKVPKSHLSAIKEFHHPSVIGSQDYDIVKRGSAVGAPEVHLSSRLQAPMKHQKYVSRVLGLPMSKVVCKTKRIGGGFGGKETRSAFLAAVAAIPSYLLNRPVKITLDRDIDMMITGQRHSFLGKYKVGFTNDGEILALDLEIYNNGGNSLDLSLAVLERAMFHSENVYEILNIRIKGKVCFTNMPSNTAFRGFGGPQGMLIAENWIQRISMEVKKTPEEIREINFQREGSILHYGQQIEHFTLERMWNELKVSCDFSRAREEVEKFNLHNRWKKRGVAIIPTKFGISFTAKFMNQAGALVQVYTDGTVLVTHGGVEMGQGLHTKVAQVPNASPTAASASSDMYGAAVLDACEQIKARMEPVVSKHSFGSFAEIEGAFVQGLGWMALEELKWGDAAHKWVPEGCMYTCGPGTYKIPSINDVPFKFNVSLLKDAPNDKAIHSSKAVGEPPFFLASAAFFAIKDAIMAARAESGLSNWFPLDNPATPERIRMACIDEFTKSFVDSDYFRPNLSV